MKTQWTICWVSVKINAKQGVILYVVCFEWRNEYGKVFRTESAFREEERDLRFIIECKKQINVSRYKNRRITNETIY